MLDNNRLGNRRNDPRDEPDADDHWSQNQWSDEGDRPESDPSGLAHDAESDFYWSAYIGSAEDDDFIADDLWEEDPFGGPTRIGETARRAWSTVRAAPVRAIAALVAVAMLGLGVQFGLLYDDAEDLAATGLGSSTTTSVVPTTTGVVEARTNPTTDTPAPALPRSAADPASTRIDGSADDDDAPADTATDRGATTEQAVDGGPAGGGAPPAGARSRSTPENRSAVNENYEANLAMIRAQTVRNRNEDDSPHRNTPSDQLQPENHYGPRSDYLLTIDGNVEPSFPVPAGGQFRVACEFSHFAYDDPLVFPNQPGASHLHMFFGNTDANAYSTADSIRNTGGGTCNGSELNRTAYWVPALFDAQGNVRIPERIVIYYKGEGLARGNAEVFPEGAAMIASVDLNTIDPAQGGAAGKFSYNCANNYSGVDENLSNTMPVCDGDRYFDQYGVRDPYTVLEVNVKFPQCWNGQEPGNPENFRHPRYAGWYGSVCDEEYNHTLVNLEYFVNYRIEPGETTSGWYLASDVSPTERTLARTPGSAIHGDWWGGWHKETNQMFIDNCVNYATTVASGCGFGYLTDGGPDNSNPYQGPALRLRDQYLGPLKVPASDLYRELCPNGGSLATAAAAAYCKNA